VAEHSNTKHSVTRLNKKIKASLTAAAATTTTTTKTTTTGIFRMGVKLGLSH